jgi:DNA-binding PadR family transcriptional regulator
LSVRNAILGLLAQKPRHGYELHAAFAAVVGEATWDVKPAQIYTTLERLEESGLVQTKSDLGEGREPDRRIYAITHDGRDALKDWFEEGVATEHQRDEFYVKLMIGLVSGEADPARVIQTQRARLYQELHDATAHRDTHDPQAEMAQILLIDKAIMHLEADLRWLDMIEMRLEAIKGQPFPEPEIRRRGRPKKVQQIIVEPQSEGMAEKADHQL